MIRRKIHLALPHPSYRGIEYWYTMKLKHGGMLLNECGYLGAKKFYAKDENGKPKPVVCEYDTWWLIIGAYETREFLLYLDAEKTLIEPNEGVVQGEIVYIDDVIAIEATEHVEEQVVIATEATEQVQKPQHVEEQVVIATEATEQVQKPQQVEEQVVIATEATEQIEEQVVIATEVDTEQVQKEHKYEARKPRLGDELKVSESLKKIEFGMLGNDLIVSDSEDEDFVAEIDSCDELLDDIIFKENVDKDVEWRGITQEMNDEESSGSSDNDVELDHIGSDFDSIGSDEAEDDISVSERASTSETQRFSLGQVFSTKQQFKDTVNDYLVRKEGLQEKWISHTHTCARQYRVDNTRTSWLSQRFEKSLRCDPKTSVKGFRNTPIKELGVYISPHQAFKAREKALKSIEGATEQYSMLWDYAEILREKNPGSTVILQVEPTLTGNSFRRFYVCLQAVKMGFRSGCRPLDRGVLLTVLCMDPNNYPYLLAYVVVGFENRESWEWFLQLLKEDLLTEREDACTFMSNMQGPKLQTLLWKAENATIIAQFHNVMLEIEKVDKNRREWLQKEKSTKEWSKSQFLTFGKCDTLVNNMCEQFNHCLLDARDKPVLTMLEWIREYMMTRFQKNRDRAETF
ncbi:hypothetical protein C2S52_015385 [Perilla frutescens var. hirtella]|nr:hypothetical protein C2S52_015385 [Perilla frutescens var. hirtella]